MAHVISGLPNSKSQKRRSQWPPFYLHRKLCKNGKPASYRQTRMPWNWEKYFKCLSKLRYFQLAKSSDHIRTGPFKNGGLCVRALRCHLSSESYVKTAHLLPTNKLGCHEIERNISSAYQNYAIFSWQNLLIILELVHLKMEVSVAEPCDVICHSVIRVVDGIGCTELK